MKNKLTKSEVERLKTTQHLLGTILEAEKSWTRERYNKEVKEYNHEEKVLKLVKEIRNLKLKGLGI